MKILSPQTLRANRENRSLPEPVAPKTPVVIDVVIPFHRADSAYLAECLQAMDNQRYCTPVLHVIADGCEFPAMSNMTAEVHYYRHSRRPGQGPYRLTNALVSGDHCKSDYLAIQDADDISLPDRLWRQVRLLEQTGAVMISSAMQNFAQDNNMTVRQKREPIVRPGVVYPSVPRGRTVNSTRTMRLDFFRRMNGFQNLTCSGDFEFDNRARFGGNGKIIDDQTVLGLRRLHSSSLSHGVAPMKSPQRDRDVSLLMKSLDAVKNCSRCAPNYGALRTTAIVLEEVT